MAQLSFGPEFEQVIAEAAGLKELSVEPGSLEIELVNAPMTTVRFTVLVDLPVEAVRAAISDALSLKE
ncbi:hypothetical protein ACFVTX_18225 [Agromyces sp. NPDC058136]|uniref:hypothetical protein n=1 Tax=Agromyces sp. NPDC058136 TaxID=3346354 RepID=UPI0036DB12CC